MADFGDRIHNGETTGDGGTHIPTPSPGAQLPSDPREIAATTSVETITTLMYDKYIYKNTLTLDSSMQAGKVFGAFKIHPNECHEYVKHFARAFKTWTGSMKFRVRFGATAFNGGSIRIGFLPPLYTRSQILNELPLSLLTAHPNEDLDPKNTDWIYFQCPDERRMKFHLMNDSGDNFDAFGGWVVFYIVMPIITAESGVGSVNFGVEVCGDFQFAQAAPLAGAGPLLAGPLVHSTQGIATAQGCDDASLGVGYNSLQILSSSIVSLEAGFTFGGASGNRSPASIQPSVESRVVQYRRKQYQTGSQHIVASGSLFREGSSTGYSLKRGAYLNPGNIEPSALTFVAQAANKVTIDKFTGYTLSQKDEDFYLQYEGADTPFYLMFEPSQVNATVPINVPTIKVEGDNAKLVPMPGNESIVVFANLLRRSYSIHTREMANDLASTPGGSDQISWVYALKSKNGDGPILLMRLCANGVFTTTATAKDVIIGFKTDDDYFLEYQQDLPVNSPLPSTASQLNRSTYGLARSLMNERVDGMRPRLCALSLN